MFGSTNNGRATTRPVKKRSRASKKTTSTVLNASPANFRALVQQFTGFQALSSSVSVQRDPVYLSFGGTKQGLLQTACGAANNSRNHHHYLHHQQHDQKPIAHGNSTRLGSANNNVQVEEDGSLIPDYHDSYSLDLLSLDSFLI